VVPQPSMRPPVGVSPGGGAIGALGLDVAVGVGAVDVAALAIPAPARIPAAVLPVMPAQEPPVLGA
jgi:hypothetical protein